MLPISFGGCTVRYVACIFISPLKFSRNPNVTVNCFVDPPAILTTVCPTQIMANRPPTSYGVHRLSAMLRTLQTHHLTLHIVKAITPSNPHSLISVPSFLLLLSNFTHFERRYTYVPLYTLLYFERPSSSKQEALMRLLRNTNHPKSLTDF